MRNWRNWLLPILTFLTAACLTVLPPRLSDWGDRALTGSVHTETLREDNNFPVRPPALERRLELAAAASLPDSGHTEAVRELGARESAEMTKKVREELRVLAELGIVPQETAEETEFSFTYVYLRDSKDLASARFLQVYNRRWPLFLLLDGETGLTLRVRIYDWRCSPDPAEAGVSFLKRLGLSGEVLDGSRSFAVLQVPDSIVRYNILVYSTRTEIWPWLEEAETETDAAMASNGPASPSVAVRKSAV